jgi:hypothetical protein
MVGWFVGSQSKGVGERKRGKGEKEATDKTGQNPLFETKTNAAKEFEIAAEASPLKRAWCTQRTACGRTDCLCFRTLHQKFEFKQLRV